MAETELPNLWGPIAMASWHATPCIRGRVATEVDVKNGKAVFYLDLSTGQNSWPSDCALPCCAILHAENGDVPVIVIQIQTSINNVSEAKIFAGYRLLAGGNGICLLSELELLNEPDARFTQDDFVR
jgi:hypothetical protein